MLDAIDASGLKDDTFVMLSADHGGKGGFGGQGGHGGQTDEEMSVPMFLRGRVADSNRLDTCLYNDRKC